MDEKELIKSLDKNLIKEYRDIEAMLSTHGLKLNVTSSTRENEPYVFYFTISNDKNNVSILYDYEFTIKLPNS